MTVYYGIIAGLTAFWALLQIGGRRAYKDRLFLVVAFVLLAGLSAFRYSVGIDYNMVYSPQYDAVLAVPAGFPFTDSRLEPGFVWLEKVIALSTPHY